MTVALSAEEVAAKIDQKYPSSVIDSKEDSLLVQSQSFSDVMSFLKTTPEFEFNYLNCITAVDYFDYFEVVYHLTSMVHNHSLVVRIRCYGRKNLSVPSITGLFQGANVQEREIYDLMGINFAGHPNMTRIFLWDGFEGHPLRKDYL